MEPPKSAPNGSCSEDLERARALSRSLRGDSRARSPAQGAPAPYATFGAQRPPPPSVPPAPPAAAPPRPQLPLMTRREPLNAPPAGFGAVGWNRLLDACVAAAGAEAAFLMDPQGLIIASRGPQARAELEGVGARLMVAFDQADRIEDTRAALAMTVETNRGTLHGLRLFQPDAPALTLGLLVAAGLTGERQARLLAIVAAAGQPERVGADR